MTPPKNTREIIIISIAVTFSAFATYPVETPIVTPNGKPITREISKYTIYLMFNLNIIIISPKYI